ncbi:MAG: transcription termination factor NusA [Oscillospiraceae bacterium]|nr:transcription termination factor NusA [Oscillospiraceae bacterium]
MSNANAEIFDAMRELEKEKGIDGASLLEAIRTAIVIAVKKDYGCEDENVAVVLDMDTGKFSVALHKTVVEEVENPAAELTVEQAQAHKKSAKVGDTVEIKLQTKQFGRIAAQTAKHVLRQGIREVEMGQQWQDLDERNQEMVTALVKYVHPVTGAATVEIGRGEALLPKNEQLPTDNLREGDRVKVFIVSVKSGDKGPRALLSRTHPGLVGKLLAMQVPEIEAGVVEIKAVSREAGFRSKVAVRSNDENVDAVSACIGLRGARVADIVEELGGEKLDIIEYSDDPAVFIAAALAPAKVVQVVPDPSGEKVCRAVVPDGQLSLAIGNKGQNARLAVRLTGWKIDIHAESEG